MTSDDAIINTSCLKYFWPMTKLFYIDQIIVTKYSLVGKANSTLYEDNNSTTEHSRFRCHDSDKMAAQHGRRGL